MTILKFQGKNGNAFSLPKKEVGLDELKFMKKVLTAKQLDFDNIEKQICGYHGNPRISMPNSYFGFPNTKKIYSRNFVTIIVPKHFLNQFVHYEIEYELEPTINKKYKLCYKLEEIALIVAWRKSRFPLNWNTVKK